MAKRPLTPGYLFFYILFLPDAWQIVAGVAAACILAPRAITPESGVFDSVMMYIMIATIGYAACRPLAAGITRMLKKWILGGKMTKL